MEPGISNSGIVAQSVQQSGRYVAGRDITITETKIVRSKPEFSEFNLEPYNKKNYLSPRFTSQLLRCVFEKKLIIIGGSYGFDKGAFIRHLASLIVEESPGITAKEWIYASDYYSVFSLMTEEKAKTVFVLNQISPQNVNYNISKLIEIANQHSHYILVSTNNPVEAWKMTSEIQKEYWFDIPSMDLYEPSLLTGMLCRNLNKEARKLRFAQPVSSFTNATPITSKLTVEDIAFKLQMPYRIDLFCKLISREEDVLSEDSILQKLSDITKDTGGEILKQWFHSLSEKEKVIVLAFILFDGLYDDQFFSAVKYVVNDYWYLRDNKLRVLDYCDLESVLNFYKLEAIDEDKKILKSKFPNQRIELLKTVWFSHRRHVTLVLPTLVKLIRNSVYTPYLEWELYGNDQRKEKLHNVISEILCDIGAISLPAVETTLIELASDDNIEVQSVAAKAIARWREYGKSDTSFAMLEGWQKETRVQNMFIDILEKRNAATQQNHEQSQASKSIEMNSYSRSYIRATIALTLGYASKYDSPGNLSSKVIQLLKQLTNDNEYLVRERLSEVTLPYIISLHFNQLKDYLRDLTGHADFLQAIARGLANAYANSPAEVMKLLNEWADYCRKNSSSINNSRRYSQVDKVLVTVLLTLGEIDYPETDAVMGIQKGFEMIVSLQQEFRQYKFRTIIAELVRQQIKRNFSKYKTHLIPLVENLNSWEQDQIMNLFYELYFEERRDLRNGEEYMRVGHNYFAVWIDNPRPITNIENSLFEWLDSGSEIAQQIAAKTFLKFTHIFDISESHVIKQIIENRKRATEQSSEISHADSSDARIKSNFFINLGIQFSGIPDSIIYLIKNIAPIPIRLRATEEHYDVMGNNWKNKSEHHRELGQYLKKVSRNYKTVRVLSTVVFILAVIFFFAILVNQ